MTPRSSEPRCAPMPFWSTSVVMLVWLAVTSAWIRPSRVLPCATATSARLLSVPSSVRSWSVVMPMYVAAGKTEPEHGRGDEDLRWTEFHWWPPEFFVTTQEYLPAGGDK